MVDYNKILDQINFAEKSEKSLKEFSNWIFGIAIAFCSLLIFQFKNFDFSTYMYAKYSYKGLVIYSMVALLLAGLIKYLILNRENKMNIYYGTLLKLIALQATKSKEELKVEWDEAFQKWINEHNKIKLMAQGLNVAIVFTLLLVLFTGLFIIIFI